MIINTILLTILVAILFKMYDINKKVSKKDDEIQEHQQIVKLWSDRENAERELLLYMFSDLMQNEDALEKLSKQEIMEIACKVRMATMYNTKRELKDVQDAELYLMKEIHPKVYGKDYALEWEQTRNGIYLKYGVKVNEKQEYEDFDPIEYILNSKSFKVLIIPISILVVCVLLYVTPMVQQSINKDISKYKDSNMSVIEIFIHSNIEHIKDFIRIKD